MFKEFKEFALKGSMVDMATGIIIGAAFSTVVKSLVDDIIMPPIGLLLGEVDFSNLFLVIKDGTPPPPYGSVESAASAGAVTINYGLFINNIISLLIVALALFFVIRAINRLRREMEGEQKEEEAAQPEPSTTEVLLTEIRDELKK